MVYRSLAFSGFCAQIVKYFLDPKTFEKVKFVYPKKEESMGVLRKSFDFQMLPEDFGGESNVHYDHEEFARLMAKDDAKSAAIWGEDQLPEHLRSHIWCVCVRERVLYFKTQFHASN